jgi:hypothetical protein
LLGIKNMKILEHSPSSFIPKSLSLKEVEESSSESIGAGMERK